QILQVDGEVAGIVGHSNGSAVGNFVQGGVFQRGDAVHRGHDVGLAGIEVGAVGLVEGQQIGQVLNVVGINRAFRQGSVRHHGAIQNLDLYIVAPLSHHVGDVVGEIHETGGDTENDAGLVGISGAGLLTG